MVRVSAVAADAETASMTATAARRPRARLGPGRIEPSVTEEFNANGRKTRHSTAWAQHVGYSKPRFLPRGEGGHMRLLATYAAQFVALVAAGGAPAAAQQESP